MLYDDQNKSSYASYGCALAMSVFILIILAFVFII